MSQLLQSIYDELIVDFKNQNSIGRGEVDYRLVSEPAYQKTEENKGLLSWYYTKSDGDDNLVIHLYCYDRCRVNQVLPDGNTLTVTLTLDGQKQFESFSWLDER
jgi:hypothetical protein